MYFDNLVILIDEQNCKNYDNKIFEAKSFAHLPLNKICHFTGDLLEIIFMNEIFCNTIWNSLRFVPKGLIADKLALVQVMAWVWIGDKQLPKPMMT